MAHVCIIIDSARSRTDFSQEETEAVQSFADAAGESGLSLAVFNGPDLSITGGLWRRTLDETAKREHHGAWRQLGLEAISYLVLVSTLVYLDHAPDLEWAHANYLG